MKTIKICLVSIIGAIYILTINSLWYALIVNKFFPEINAFSIESIKRTSPNIPIIFISFFVLSLLMTIIFFYIRFENNKKLGNVFFVGAILGLLYVAPSSMYYFGLTEILSFTKVISDLCWHIVEEGSAGVVVYYLFKKGNLIS